MGFYEPKELELNLKLKVNPEFQNIYLPSPSLIRTLLVLIRLQSQFSPKQKLYTNILKLNNGIIKNTNFPDPRLRTVAKTVEVVDDSIKKLTQDMLETMYQGSGIGLAATQVNVHKRVIVLDISESKDEPLILINPEIIKIIDPNKKIFSEGCLSVPGFYEELKKA